MTLYLRSIYPGGLPRDPPKALATSPMSPRYSRLGSCKCPLACTAMRVSRIRQDLPLHFLPASNTLLAFSLRPTERLTAHEEYCQRADPPSVRGSARTNLCIRLSMAGAFRIETSPPATASAPQWACIRAYCWVDIPRVLVGGTKGGLVRLLYGGCERPLEGRNCRGIGSADPRNGGVTGLLIPPVVSM